jgi:hypothetical protein
MVDFHKLWSLLGREGMKARQELRPNIWAMRHHEQPRGSRQFSHSQQRRQAALLRYAGLKNAHRASNANLERFEHERAQLEADNIRRRGEAERVAGLSEIIIHQAGESSSLCGSVVARDIAVACTEGGLTITREKVPLGNPIKAVSDRAFDRQERIEDFNLRRPAPDQGLSFEDNIRPIRAIIMAGTNAVWFDAVGPEVDSPDKV